MKRTATVAAVLVCLAALSGCKRCGGEASTQPAPSRQAGGPATGGSAPAPAAPPEGRSDVLKALPGVGKPSDGASLGTNVTALEDWNTAIPFIDAFHTARVPFTSGAASGKWDDGRQVPVDEDGWLERLLPGQVARIMMFTSARPRPGRYVVLYDGKGRIEYWDSGALVAEESKPGRDVVQVREDGSGLKLNVVEVDPADPLRRIRVLPPGGACAEDHARFCDASTPCPSGECLSFEKHHEQLVFHPDFLASIQRYGVIRFMDMLGTNNSEHEGVDDLPKMTDATWATPPVEVMAKLVNELHAQPWFALPHMASDAYVRRFAEQVKQHVDPKLPVWIEYSNEVWNGQFRQHRYAIEQGEKRGYGSGYGAGAKFYGQRAVEMFRIFEQVLGKQRLVRIIASQAGNPDVARTILQHGDVAKNADVLAIAPYFGWGVGPAEKEQARRMSVDQVIEHARKESIPLAHECTRKNAEVAREFGLELVAYEGGQHYVGVMGVENDDTLTELFHAFNRDPRMADLYREYLDGWRKNGGTWFVHYNNCGAFSKWGDWGSLEHIRQPPAQAPKYRALMKFMDDNERWW